VRVASMRNAQIISAVLYVVSVILFMPIVQNIDLINIDNPPKPFKYPMIAIKIIIAVVNQRS
jgi:uncharacterized integral membrane protein